LGFPHVLHYWGVRRVISALWPVLDVAMVLLYADFYSQPDCLESPAQALSAARSALRVLTSEQACERLATICSGDVLHQLQSEVAYLVLEFGVERPFSDPLVWACTTVSGLWDAHSTP